MTAIKINFKTAYKEITKLSIPLIGHRMIIHVNSFLAMLLIASLGHRELAASAYIVPIQTTINIAGWSIIFAISIIIGYIFGQGKMVELGKALRQGLLIAIILAIPMMMIFWYIGDILLLLGQDKNLVELVRPYFRILTFSVLPIILSLCLIQFLTGIGRPKMVVLLSLLSIVTTLVIGYPLLFGRFGLPRLGITGLAYTNVIGAWLNCAIIYIYVWHHPYCKQFQIFKFSLCERPKDWHYLKQIVRLGLPMSGQFILELSAFSFTVIMVGWINQASLAAAQIINQISMIMIMGSFGISQACSVLVSQALGQNDRYAAKFYSEAAFILGIIFSIIVALLYTIFPKLLISIYSLDVTNPANFATVSIAITLFYICATSQFFDGLRNILTGALRGFQDSATPMWISAIVIWLFDIPLGYILGIKLHYGASGICFSFLLACILATILLFRRFYRMVK